MLHPGMHIHVIGVGGFGMSAIARVLLQQGYTISGSDLRANAFTRDLATAGATIYAGHAAEHIAGADLVVTTSAAPDDNPELVAARAAGVPVLRRRDLLGELMAHTTGIAIAGTHGKTTTTALLAHVLIAAGRDPTYIIGGVLHNSGHNAAVGRGEHFVIEADEYDHMFLGLRPQIAVVTTLEHDHPDCFPTLNAIRQAFADFVGRLPHDGLLVAGTDDPEVWQLAEAWQAAGHSAVTYGFMGQPAWSAHDLQIDTRGGTSFTIEHNGQPVGRARLNMLGCHNVQNALAVLAVADYVGVPFQQTAAAFDSFLGTGRRSEVMGRAGGVTVVNDYAHHPTAICVTLAALREWPGRRALWAVWQPHTFGRLRALAEDFAASFHAADHVLVTDVYSVREDPTPGLDAASMAGMIDHPDAQHTGSLAATAATLIDRVQPGDVIVLLSAGDAPQIGQRVLEHFSEE